MKPQELRIDNIVTIDNEKYHPSLKNIPLQIEGIYENSNGYVVNLEHINKEPNTYYESYCQNIKFIKPILLTEELLTKNWIKDEYESRYPLTQDGKLHITVQHPLAFWEDQSICFTALFYGEPIGKISSIHQLQNLYFALTGQELEITL